jgi:DNA repair protein RecO (recombination protein O)
MAKGVRKITSRRAGSLELFNHLSLVICEGKGMDSIIEVNVINSFASWRGNLRSIGVAYYLCELVDRLTVDDQEHQVVFAVLLESLKANSSKKARQIILSFEKQLLNLLGFGIPEKYLKETESLKTYIEEITEKKIISPKVIKEIW